MAKHSSNLIVFLIITAFIFSLPSCIDVPPGTHDAPGQSNDSDNQTTDSDEPDPARSTGAPTGTLALTLYNFNMAMQRGEFDAALDYCETGFYNEHYLAVEEDWQIQEFSTTEEYGAMFAMTEEQLDNLSEAVETIQGNGGILRVVGGIVNDKEVGVDYLFVRFDDGWKLSGMEWIEPVLNEYWEEEDSPRDK